jgi:hypothetical protein
VIIANEYIFGFGGGYAKNLSGIDPAIATILG